MDTFWVDTWNYKTKRGIRSFKIRRKSGALIYEETIGNKMVNLTASLDSRGNAHIKSRKLQFEIKLNKEKVTAQFKQKNNKWNEPIRIKRHHHHTEKRKIEQKYSDASISSASSQSVSHLSVPTSGFGRR